MLERMPAGVRTKAGGDMASPASSADFPEFDLVSPEKYEREGYPHDDLSVSHQFSPRQRLLLEGGPEPDDAEAE